jgi:hypothetical protein
MGGSEGVALRVRVQISKSLKIAPCVKVCMNAKRISVTMGSKGVHYTANSKDLRTATCRVPGANLR